MNDRSQFTCYRSFYEAIKRIKKVADRALAYDILMEYALNGTVPDVDKLPDSVAIAFHLIKPTLDTSKRKAENGKRGGTAKQTEAKPKQSGSKTEANRSKAEANASEGEKENKKEKENEIEIEKESYNSPQTPFGRFWAAYPRKEGKGDAEKAFKKVKAPLQVLLDAIERQKLSSQWQADNGRFIPHPATWLNGKRWEDELQAATSSGSEMGELELAAIRRMMGTEGF